MVTGGTAVTLKVVNLVGSDTTVAVTVIFPFAVPLNVPVMDVRPVESVVVRGFEKLTAAAGLALHRTCCPEMGEPLVPSTSTVNAARLWPEVPVCEFAEMFLMLPGAAAVTTRLIRWEKNEFVGGF